MRDEVIFARPVAFRDRFPLLTRFSLFVLVTVAALGCFAYSLFDNSLPSDRVVLSCEGLSEPVSIERDAHGVPHIKASTDDDAFFAIGYVHAQDRLWQLELQRRTVRGELSEVFGKNAIQSDIWFRTLDVLSSAKSAWPVLSSGARESLAKYTAGINAAIAAQSSLPVEFKILGIKPGRWTEYDSLAWIKIFALDLGMNFRLEMKRHIATQMLSAQQMQAFFPDHSRSAPTVIQRAGAVTNENPSAEIFRFYQFLAHDLQLGGPAVGSNAWVAAGRYSADGAALLANDPHLGLQIPSPWYVIHAKGHTLDVSGMSLVGLPFVVFGRNAHIGWGGTNMTADTQDLFLEKADPENAARYEVNGHWESFDNRVETIRIRPDLPELLHQKYEPIRVSVRSTRHGPVISDQFKVFDHVVALRWTALEPGDTSYEAFYRIQFASAWTEFCGALSFLVAPAMNMVYADRAGNIGYSGAGKIPIRKSGVGVLPSPGWNEEFAWTGYIPAAQLPHIYNPVSGFIVTANNKVVADDYPYFISRDWASPSRAQRITQMLEERIRSEQRLTIDDMQRIQADTIDGEAAKLSAEIISELKPKNANQIAALRSLQGWNGDMAGDSQPAAIFNVWMRHLRKQLFESRLRPYWNKPEQAAFLNDLSTDVSSGTLREILADRNSPWCEQEAGLDHETCRQVLQSSLQEALVELAKLTGNRSMSSWRWDELQQAVYLHRPFSDVKLVRAIFERKIRNGGTQDAINVAAGPFVEKEGFSQEYGPSFRQIISLGKSRVSYEYMNSTGQSGNVISRHYADMIEPFHEVQYYQLGADVDQSAPSSKSSRLNASAKN